MGEYSFSNDSHTEQQMHNAEMAGDRRPDAPSSPGPDPEPTSGMLHASTPMSESPSVSTPMPNGSVTSPRARRQPSSLRKNQSKKNQSKRKRIFAALLIAFGVPLGLLAFFVVYPKPETGIPNPIPSQIRIGTSAPIDVFVLDIKQITPTIARMTFVIGLVRSGDGAIDVTLPLGVTFDCPITADCKNSTQVTQSYWIQGIKWIKSGPKYPAVAVFYVNSSDFGVDFDGINALAAIPSIHLDLSGNQSEKPLVWVGFHIPNASSYDWSTFPTQKLTSSAVVWSQYLNTGDNQGRITVGANHSRQANDTNLTFFAGALIGIAGAAILAGLQEFFHSFDDELLEYNPPDGQTLICVDQPS